MLVSIVIPCFKAQAFIARAIRSVLLQSHGNWEAILVSDDTADYGALLQSNGISDPRIRNVSTGVTGSGCHRARNAGLAVVGGDAVTQLDADDEMTPDRLESLLPLVRRHGAAADNLLLQDPAERRLLYTVLGTQSEVTSIGLSDFFTLTAPLVPLVARQYVEARTEGVELAEDVIANMRLIAKIGSLPILPTSSYVYNVLPESMCHEPEAERRFAEAYDLYIERLRSGDGFGLPQDLRRIAAIGLEAKRALNDEFGAAVRQGFLGSFQDFAVRRRSTDRAGGAEQEKSEA